jgi:hypothetical protein
VRGPHAHAICSSILFSNAEVAYRSLSRAKSDILTTFLEETCTDSDTINLVHIRRQRKGDPSKHFSTASGNVDQAIDGQHIMASLVPMRADPSGCGLNRWTCYPTFFRLLQSQDLFVGRSSLSFGGRDHLFLHIRSLLCMG